METLEFIKAKYGSFSINDEGLDNFSRGELAELIEEYCQIIEHINKPYVKVDDKPVSASEWIKYNEQYNQWREEWEGKTNTMDAQMMKPNKPSYFIANND